MGSHLLCVARRELDLIGKHRSFVISFALCTILCAASSLPDISRRVPRSCQVDSLFLQFSRPVWLSICSSAAINGASSLLPTSQSLGPQSASSNISRQFIYCNVRICLHQSSSVSCPQLSTTGFRLFSWISRITSSDQPRLIRSIHRI